MKRQLFIICALVATVFAVRSAEAVEFSAGELAKLEAGRTLKKPLSNSRVNGFYGGTGWTLIDAPADVVWEAIQDWGSYPKAFPKTVSVKEVARRGDRSLLRMEQGHQLLRIAYHIEVERNPAKHMISFKLAADRPHDIDDTRGYWRLFPQADGRTLVAYVVAVQVPMGIINFVGATLEEKIERNLLGIPEYLKKWLAGPGAGRYGRTLASR